MLFAAAKSSGISGTLVVAMIALVLSASTLTWQIVQFLLGGARVSAELHFGAHDGGGVVHGPADKPLQWDRLTGQGYTERLLGVQVRNRGRLAVSVTAWSVVLDNGAAYSHGDWHINQKYPLPFRLEPGAEAVWFCPLEPVVAMGATFQKSNRPAGTVQAQAGLGTGRTVKSRNGLSVGALGR